MNRPGQVSFAFPRPGRALTVLLITIAAFGIIPTLFPTTIGDPLFQWLACDLDKVKEGQLWRLLTSGLLTSRITYSHVIFTLIGLYFLSGSLIERWGSWRFLRFVGLSVLAGNLIVLGVNELPLSGLQFHPPFPPFGASAAIAAIAVAWSREYAESQALLFFVLPVKGKYFLWVTLGFCVLNVIYPGAAGLPEGVMAPFGGVLTGLLLAGSPSVVRSTYLRAKLAFLRRSKKSLRVEDLLEKPRPGGGPKRAKASGAPPLRVVQGGLDEVLKNRKPPKDKRYLN